MHRRRAEFVLDALEVIEPLDRAIEFGAFLLGELGFHLGNRVGELRAIEFLDRGGDIGEHRKAFLRHFGETAEHNELLMRAARGHREDFRPDRGDDRRMAGEHAEIALDAGVSRPVFALIAGDVLLQFFDRHHPASLGKL